MARISRKITPTRNWGSLTNVRKTNSTKSLKRRDSEDSLESLDEVASVSNLEPTTKTKSKYLVWLDRIFFHVCSFRNFLFFSLVGQAIAFIVLAIIAILVSGASITDDLQFSFQKHNAGGVKQELTGAASFLSLVETYINSGRLASMGVDDLSKVMHPAMDTAYGVDAFLVTKTGDDFVLLRHEKNQNGTTTAYRTYTTDAYSTASATGSSNKMNVVNLNHNYDPVSVGSSVTTLSGALFDSSVWFTKARFRATTSYLVDTGFTLEGTNLGYGGIWVFSRVKMGADDWVVGAYASLLKIGQTLKDLSLQDEQVMLADLSTERILLSTQDIESVSLTFTSLTRPVESAIGAQLSSYDSDTFIEGTFYAEGHTVLVSNPLASYEGLSKLRVVSYKSRLNYPAKAFAHPAVIICLIASVLVAVVIALILVVSFFVPLHLLSEQLKRIARLKDGTSVGTDDVPTRVTDNIVSRVKWSLYPFGEIRELNKIVSLTKLSTSYLKKYAPVDLLKFKLDHNEPLTLSMAPAKMSILFSDLVDFTALASRLKAEKFVLLLSEYFEEMIAVIESNNGHLDKLVGDAIMCLFVANRFKPCLNHEEMSVKTALRMQTRLKEMNQVWKEKGFPSLKMRIGVATGESMMGNIGSEAHFSYTAISSSVNVSARLESLNTYFGTSQLIEQKTYSVVKDKYLCYWVDSVALKGRNTGTHVYELRKPRKQAQRAEIDMEEQLLFLRNMLVERKFTKVISRIDSLKKNPAAPSYINKLKKRSADLLLCGEAADCDISLFLNSK